MASIYLVRHGQAGFGKLNYDQLSDLGHEQGALVGQSLLGRHIEAGNVVHGAMQRHRETMVAAQTVWHAFGPIIEHAGFNEFDSDDVIACAHPKFAQKAVLGTYLMSQKNPKKTFQHLFESAIERWISGDFDSDYIESWSHFKNRCVEALQQIIEQANGKNVVVFTSGGPITAIAQYCLDLSDQRAFDLNWTLVNGGITQILFNQQGKISLASCNEQEHLIRKGKKFLTYR